MSFDTLLIMQYLRLECAGLCQFWAVNFEKQKGLKVNASAFSSVQHLGFQS